MKKSVANMLEKDYLHNKLDGLYLRKRLTVSSPDTSNRWFLRGLMSLDLLSGPEWRTERVGGWRKAWSSQCRRKMPSEAALHQARGQNCEGFSGKLHCRHL